MAGSIELFGIVSYDKFLPDILQGPRYARDISSVIVNYRYHLFSRKKNLTHMHLAIFVQIS
jgi:hypothetical protein